MSEAVVAARSATKDVLTVTGLTVDLLSGNDSTRVVDGVDLALRPGETVGLVGESGSGKTLTGLAILRLLPQGVRMVAGRVVFDGEDLTRMPVASLRKVRGAGIAMIFQEPSRSLDPSFAVGRQIAEGIRVHLPVSRREAWNRAVEMLDRVRIPRAHQRAHDYPHQLSGGMCQRVMLAVALACSPKVLIADEPTTALDVTVQAEILRLIGDLQKDMGLSVLLITHDLGIVAEVCDRVTVMYAGQTVENGPTAGTFDRPRHPYSAALLQTTPLPTNRRGTALPVIPGVVPPPGRWPTGCHFYARCDFREPRCAAAPPPVVSLGAECSARCVRAEELTLGGER